MPQCLRYATVGGLATAFHYAVLLTLVEVFHNQPSYSAAIGAGCGALLAYYAKLRFVFKLSASWISWCRVLFVAVIAAALSGLLVWVANSLFLLHYLAAQIVATLAMLILTYLASASWTFK